MADTDMTLQEGGPPSTTLPDENFDATPNAEDQLGEQKMSKNQLRKIRRRQKWEDAREDRKIKRKEKRHAKVERKREEIRARMAEAELQGLDPKSVLPEKSKKAETVRVPIAIVVDNDFHRYMTEGEFVSMSSQLTRCYSDNRRSPFNSHLVLSDWKGPMLERFDTVLRGNYKKWTSVCFSDKDFVAACQDAFSSMEASKNTDVVCPALATAHDSTEPPIQKGETEAGQGALPDIEETTHKSIVYLTAESPYTIERLEPNTCYVVGGIVDRNREKGLCYRRAKERGVRTAKLPIGEYLQMASRKVLATNHVVEIMLKWLESGDWGNAFLEVIPKRKGGQLKDAEDEASASNNGGAQQDQEDGEEGSDQEEDGSVSLSSQQAQAETRCQADGGANGVVSVNSLPQ
ncbi:hypothetical protein MKZ38_001351 [Zalerion maritima]|uniref:tRNA (guanine(9)-N1)-methyltransferase n=1 Tax=Zalerion maritima TaxID=339359 RepID=A0AAD5RQB7_9PEZI|nr:hypothetical protein MKZ38_001351 [Zalerion maritima]